MDEYILHAKDATLFYLSYLALFASDSWNKTSHPMEEKEFGKWEIFLPNNEDGSPPISHLSKYKVRN